MLLFIHFSPWQADQILLKDPFPSSAIDFTGSDVNFAALGAEIER